MEDVKKLIECIDKLIVKASEAEKADDALKFSQAACNSANALVAIKNSDMRSK